MDYSEMREIDRRHNARLGEPQVATLALVSKGYKRYETRGWTEFGREEQHVVWARTDDEVSAWGLHPAQNGISNFHAIEFEATKAQTISEQDIILWTTSRGD